VPAYERIWVLLIREYLQNAVVRELVSKSNNNKRCKEITETRCRIRNARYKDECKNMNALMLNGALMQQRR
jgi:hypothetical protein